jgi:hypothetical protein
LSCDFATGGDREGLKEDEVTEASKEGRDVKEEKG